MRPYERLAIFPFDVDDLLEAALARQQRAPDGKLHPSGALDGSLRHLQLEMAGAPMEARDPVADIRNLAGTAIHNWFETEVFRGQPVMTEVKLDRWLPAGWSGTADWIAWDAERRAFVLGDAKTVKPGAIHWAQKGIKETHMWQVSSYFWACVEMGLPMVNGFCIYHIPMSQLLKREGSPVQPYMAEVTPKPREEVHARMAERKAAVDTYLAECAKTRAYFAGSLGPSNLYRMWLNDELAPVQERETKHFLNTKLAGGPVIDHKLVPNWSTDYCPFPEGLCDCNLQTANKVGHWTIDESGDACVYVPSAKQEQPADIIAPDPALIARLRKELDA